MTGKRTAFFIALVLAFFFIMQSCRKSPYPCYSTSVNIDSIHINIPVTFNASCSSYANGYRWKITGPNPDSIYIGFSAIATVTFSDTGNVDVYLLVINGNQSNSSDQTIHVNP